MTGTVPIETGAPHPWHHSGLAKAHPELARCALPAVGERSDVSARTLDLTHDEAALLLTELNGLIDGTATSSPTVSRP